MIGWRGGDGPELTADWPWRPRRRGQSALEGARGLCGRPACQLAGAAGERGERGVGSRNAVREARCPAPSLPSPAPRALASFPPLPCIPAWGLGRGTEGRDLRGSESGVRGGGGPGAERGARRFLFSLRSRRLLAGCRGPGRAGLPGRPHYAGGLPAAAMASRTAVRAGRSPHQPRVRAAAAAPAGAALPHSHSGPLPPRSSSSSSPPMPPFLLLLLVLLLLLEDAGAQQGEWLVPRECAVRGAPRAAGEARGEPAGRQGCGPGAGSATLREGAGCLACVGSPGPALARWSCKARISLLSPSLAQLYFFWQGHSFS